MKKIPLHRLANHFVRDYPWVEYLCRGGEDFHRRFFLLKETDTEFRDDLGLQVEFAVVVYLRTDEIRKGNGSAIDLPTVELNHAKATEFLQALGVCCDISSFSTVSYAANYHAYQHADPLLRQEDFIAVAI